MSESRRATDKRDGTRPKGPMKDAPSYGPDRPSANQLLHLPWEHDPRYGFDGFPCGLTVAVDEAIDHAWWRIETRVMFDHPHLDWASVIQHTCDLATPERLLSLLPTRHPLVVQHAREALT